MLEQSGAGITSTGFIVPLVIAGTGMGLIFVPLFDIVLGGVGDHEVGSASSALQAIQQLGMALGIAVIGTIFFGQLDTRASSAAALAHEAVGAAQTTSLVTIGLIVVAFALGFLLPRHARAQAM